jgi:hypothetical protein
VAVENYYNFGSNYYSDRYNIFLIEQRNRSIKEIEGNLIKDGVKVINLGKEFAYKLKSLNTTKYIIVDAPILLRKLFDEHNIISEKCKKPAIAIYNLGILLEPTLALAAESILGNLSYDKVIIIIWNHLIKNRNILYWSDKTYTSYHFDFSEYNLKNW